MTLKKIIVGTDFSEQADVAIGHAMAVARHTGSDLILMHALGISQTAPTLAYPVALPEVYTTQVREIRIASKEKLEALATSFDGQGVKVSPCFVDDMPEDGVVNAAEQENADLIVVGSHGRTGLTRFLLGSVAERVAKKASCDVLVARDAVPEGCYRHLLVPTDFSEISDRAVARAVELVEPGGTIELLHCWQLPGGPATYWGKVGPGLRENIRRGAVDFGEKCIEKFATDSVNFVFTEQEGDARHELEKRANKGEYDLLVMGTHGRKGLQRMLLGSVTESTIRHTKKSVYLVRG